MELPYVLEGKSRRSLLGVRRGMRRKFSLSVPAITLPVAVTELAPRHCAHAMHSRYVGGNNLAIEEEVCSQRDVSASRVRLNAQVLRIFSGFLSLFDANVALTYLLRPNAPLTVVQNAGYLELAKMSAEPLKPKTWGTSDVRRIS